MTLRTQLPLALLWALAFALVARAAGEEPAGLRARIERVVRAEVPECEGLELPPLARVVPRSGGEERGALRFEVVAAGPLRGDRLSLRVASFDGARLLKRTTITARIYGTREVAVATRGLHARERIGKGDFELLPVPLADLREEAFGTGDDLVGQRTTRALREGQVLHRSFVERSPSVVRGQRVKLRVAHAGLRIEAVGEAQEDGRTGEWIRVLNPKSRREVLGRVVGEGVVRVDL